MHNLFLKRITFLFISVALFGCGEKDEIIPINIVGTYSFTKISGSVTIDKTKTDIKDTGDFMELSDEVIFKNDGTVFFDSDKYNYSISGNEVTVIQDGLTVKYKATLSNDLLTLQINKGGFSELLELFNQFSDDNEKITDIDVALVYEKVSEELLAAPKPPDCLFTLITIGTAKFQYDYDNNGIVKSLTNVANGGKQTYTAYPENLGLESAAYTVYSSGNLEEKYYCDQNKRVKKRDYQLTTSKSPHQTSYYSYDAKSRIKTLTIEVFDGYTTSNPKLVEKYFREYEYKENGETKVYQTVYDANENVKTKRFLYYENTMTSLPNKSIVLAPYHFGQSTYNKLLINEYTTYYSSGRIASNYKYKYTLNDKGYVSVYEYTYLQNNESGSSSISGDYKANYDYTCK